MLQLNVHNRKSFWLFQQAEWRSLFTTFFPPTNVFGSKWFHMLSFSTEKKNVDNVCTTHMHWTWKLALFCVHSSWVHFTSEWVVAKASRFGLWLIHGTFTWMWVKFSLGINFAFSEIIYWSIHASDMETHTHTHKSKINFTRNKLNLRTLKL